MIIPSYDSKSSYAYGHDILFPGKVYYANVGKTDDSLDGKTPETAKKNINSAIAIASAGDAISVKAGTYVENIDLDKNGMEIWFEIGTLIQPVSGIPLTLSGNSCLIKGTHKIMAATTETGLLISGNECYIEYGKVLYGAFGVVVTGSGLMASNYASGFQETAAYNIQANQGRLINCSTVGSGSTTGYLIDGGADTGFIKDCTSVGHTNAGYYIDTGSQDWTVMDCSSGAGDGRWIDVDHANVFSNFNYDREMFKCVSINGDTTTVNTNLFEFTGSIIIDAIFGIVVTGSLGEDVNNCYWNVYDGTNTVALTLATDPDMDNAPIGSVIHKIANADTSAQYLQSDQVRIYEDASKYGVSREVILNAKEGVNNYVRFTYDTGADLSLQNGAIDFHIIWEPMSGDGFLKHV